MKKGFLALFMLLTSVSSQAAFINGTLYGTVPGNRFINGTAMQGYLLIATRSCKDLSCIQQNLRYIDSQIADLLARRLAFVQRGAQLKNSAVVPANSQQNPNVITQVTRQAQAQGYPPEIAQSVFQEIDRQSQAFETRYLGLAPQPSVNSFSTPTGNVSNPVITPTITPGLGVTPTVNPGQVSLPP